MTSRNGLIIDYTIECSGQAAIVTELTEFTITGLTPFTEYTCSVFASNSAGDGPSAVVVATTQTASTVPQTIRFQNSLFCLLIVYILRCASASIGMYYISK